MNKKLFECIFNESIAVISLEWKCKYQALLENEHWSCISQRVFYFLFENKITHNPLPVFSEEIIVDFTLHYEYFNPLKGLIVNPEKSKNEKIEYIAKIIEQTPIASLLIILGQRKTTATITDQNGIPPLKEALLTNCFKLHNKQISKATRAREKHISRNKEGSFWGEIKGNPQQKENTTKIILNKIFEESTWWNVFTHYKHGVVYEIRVATGQGVRWKKNNLELIGFLEPFM